MNKLIDILYAVEVGGWSLIEIVGMSCGLFLLSVSLLLILIASRREEPPQ